MFAPTLVLKSEIATLEPKTMIHQRANTSRLETISPLDPTYHQAYTRLQVTPYGRDLAQGGSASGWAGGWPHERRASSNSTGMGCSISESFRWAASAWLVGPGLLGSGPESAILVVRACLEMRGWERAVNEERVAGSALSEYVSW
jgi:hypothetical protein